jgi:hypothetical protein
VQENSFKGVRNEVKMSTTYDIKVEKRIVKDLEMSKK